ALELPHSCVKFCVKIVHRLDLVTSLGKIHFLQGLERLHTLGHVAQFTQHSVQVRFQEFGIQLLPVNALLLLDHCSIGQWRNVGIDLIQSGIKVFPVVIFFGRKDSEKEKNNRFGNQPDGNSSSSPWIGVN